MMTQEYDREFKQKAVELSFTRGSAREIPEELGIRPELLYRWGCQLPCSLKKSVNRKVYLASMKTKQIFIYRLNIEFRR